MTTSPGDCSMTSLEKRLFKLFDRADIARARSAPPVRISCPRVGQVRATVTDEAGEAHDVLLELSAGRRGGMTLETSSTTDKGRQGKPCAALAAVLLEVDRRGLFSSIHDHTPVVLNIVPADDVDGDADGAAAVADDEDARDEIDDAAPAKSRTVGLRAAQPATAVATPLGKSTARQPA